MAFEKKTEFKMETFLCHTGISETNAYASIINILSFFLIVIAIIIIIIIIIIIMSTGRIIRQLDSSGTVDRYKWL
jgi:hypothetical protein